jgi:hypothetical protein
MTWKTARLFVCTKYPDPDDTSMIKCICIALPDAVARLILGDTPISVTWQHNPDGTEPADVSEFHDKALSAIEKLGVMQPEDGLGIYLDVGFSDLGKAVSIFSYYPEPED